MIESNPLLPFRLYVTLITVVAELSRMRIIYCMAGSATIKYGFCRRRLVTRRTFQFHVRIDERETGLGVIKISVRPRRRFVTTITLLPISSLMVILTAVAIYATVLKRVFEVFTSMAIFTL